jgi:5,10-methylenetetrahydromethanopterin reductase
LPGPLRHPLLAADAMATLQGVSGARASFSIGRGDGAMKVLQRGPMPVSSFEAYLRRLQAFLRREDVDMDGAVSSMSRLDDIDPSLDTAKPPVNVAATGPRMIGVAARWADGISFAVGADLERLRECIDLAREACGSAARDIDALTLGCYVQIAVCDNGDRARAREAVRGLIMTHSRFSGYEGTALPQVSHVDHSPIRSSVKAMDAVLRSSRGGVMRTAGGSRGELDFYPRDAVDDEFIDRFGIVGPAEYCAERLQQIVDLGINRIYIGTRGVGVDLDEANADRVGREVLPLLRA